MCCPTEKSILEKEVRALKIQESAENYLEAILVLTQKNGQVRSIDVAHYTGLFQAEHQPCRWPAAR